MSTREGPKLKRFGGRWIQAGEQYRERYKVLRAVFSRAWYLLVPFVGIMWAHANYVRPVTEDVKSVVNREQGALLDQQDDIRAQVSNVQSLCNEVETELDTLFLPQIDFHGAIQDSLRQLRLVYDSNLPRSKVRLDSLAVLRDELTGDLERLSGTFRDQSTVLRELRARRATLEDSVRGLDSLIALKADELYRKQHPLEYRRKEALFTGRGAYPRRGEHPTREGGR